MVIAALLVDLDGTIIDSTTLDAARDARRWPECVKRCGETRPYEGVVDVLKELRFLGVRIGVVTSSVSFYAEAMLRLHKIPCDVLVAYHDTRRHKPEPDPFLFAAQKLGDLSPTACVGLGDSMDDLMSLKRAKMSAVAAAWNSLCHVDNEWDFAARDASDLLKFVNSR